MTLMVIKKAKRKIPQCSVYNYGSNEIWKSTPLNVHQNRFEVQNSQGVGINAFIT
jgi:hypothetical protein